MFEYDVYLFGVKVDTKPFTGSLKSMLRFARDMLGLTTAHAVNVYKLTDDGRVWLKEYAL